ncbi:patatin-like phospholipase family protein [Candidatus Albibeggiatoa sp. nov. NOAA]|uniref:patatin-like phospholipase family protein n=1 Tax=Candidatus Albibeggiatoa sp. nov. NOAA TaxID=3162724 RepID=UPI0032F4B9C9|nr:cyclic nucleotide-binding domain-containing protein [Thiotrichaceae bacterium]
MKLDVKSAKDIQHCLAQSRLFNQLDADSLKELSEAFQCLRLLRGETLFRQGDAGDAFYMVNSGRLKILVSNEDETDKPVGELLPGESFGELSLISDQTRAASIVAMRDTELGKLPKAQFQKILQKHPNIAVELLKIVGQWMNQLERGATYKASTLVTFVVLSDNPAVKALPRLLANQLAAKNTVHHLSLDQLDQKLWHGACEAFGCASITQDERLARWVSDQEQQADFIILETSNTKIGWTDFCLRQADKILYLVDAKDKPQALPAHLSALACSEIEQELVLVHPPTTRRPSQTQQWLKHYQRHHHIRQASKLDLQRLAREIANESIALVLGGGGARSFAHIGVLKAMEELGLPVDKVAGTSMGAIIAAQYADGYNSQELLELNHETWVKGKPHRDFTLPITSLLSARRAKRLTRNVFGDRHIEDLWLNFFCISTDLTRLKPYKHEQGLIWSALLASGAVPGVCSSIVSHQGTLLVDGGLLDNLPVADMRKQHHGSLIAVDVSPNDGLQPNVTTTIPPNGWRALWDYLNPMAKQRRYPHIFKLLLHTAALASKVNAEPSRQLADLCLTPPCTNHGLMDMRNLDGLVKQGYQDALPKLEQWMNRN